MSLAPECAGAAGRGSEWRTLNSNAEWGGIVAVAGCTEKQAAGSTKVEFAPAYP
jgi:hypothetical protein